MKRTLITLILSSAFLAAAGPCAADNVDYPDGYRSWTHIKTMALHGRVGYCR